jgi:hypothetical protein
MQPAKDLAPVKGRLTALRDPAFELFERKRPNVDFVHTIHLVKKPTASTDHHGSKAAENKSSRHDNLSKNESDKNEIVREDGPDDRLAL